MKRRKGDIFGQSAGASQMVLVVKNPPANTGDIRDMGSIPGSGRSPRVGNGSSTPMFLPGKFHRQRNLVCYRLWVAKNGTQLSMHTC